MMKLEEIKCRTLGATIPYTYYWQQQSSFFSIITCLSIVKTHPQETCQINSAQNWIVRHPSIGKMVSTIYPASYYGCSMRYLGENIRNNFHNSKVVSHFYKATKAYDKCEFNNHFNQIRDLVPKAAKTLKRIGFHP
ncbi:hypothetical protein H5410_057608 [Solanum commersonii]|uniref:Uncharacterized protein n=1 Tax=Solanum commersonii TaxID=4109 RepID=A0A9J5WPH1_SOLCO|nr:hypothetical protein H5410_057608 [Solanum commersonii]